MKKRSQKRNLLKRVIAGKVSAEEVQKNFPDLKEKLDPLRPVTLLIMEQDGTFRVKDGSRVMTKEEMQEAERNPDIMIIRRADQSYS